MFRVTSLFLLVLFSFQNSKAGDQTRECATNLANTSTSRGYNIKITVQGEERIGKIRNWEHKPFIEIDGRKFLVQDEAVEAIGNQLGLNLYSSDLRTIVESPYRPFYLGVRRIVVATQDGKIKGLVTAQDWYEHFGKSENRSFPLGRPLVRLNWLYLPGYISIMHEDRKY